MNRSSKSHAADAKIGKEAFPPAAFPSAVAASSDAGSVDSPVSDETVNLGITDNAILLAGFLAAALSTRVAPTFAVSDIEPQAAAQIIEHMGTGNRYRVSVTQISGCP